MVPLWHKRWEATIPLTKPPESDLIHSVADEINIPGVFTIGGHGTPTSIESATRSIMTAKDLNSCAE
ncbi:hypothetical protein C2U48_15235 [Escherichia coli]|nr:hypothetical protein C2U48_15235 [Escherichia coli]